MKIRTEHFLALTALILISIVIATRDLSMSNTVHMMLLGFFTVGVFSYATFIYKERPADEREQAVSMIASKYAYVIGSAVMSLGIVIQSLSHNLDIWLPVTLGLMVVAKTAGHLIHN